VGGDADAVFLGIKGIYPVLLPANSEDAFFLQIKTIDKGYFFLVEQFRAMLNHSVYCFYPSLPAFPTQLLTDPVDPMAL
jgi:hypothetical protein